MSLREDALYEEAYKLYRAAKYKDKDFNEDDYKWVMGWQAFKVFVSKSSVMDDTISHKYLNIDINIDLHNDWEVELWKKVTL